MKATAKDKQKKARSTKSMAEEGLFAFAFVFLEKTDSFLKYYWW